MRATAVAEQGIARNPCDPESTGDTQIGRLLAAAWQSWSVSGDTAELAAELERLLLLLR
jgi:hypothetical protein